MEIAYKTNKLGKTFASPKNISACYGTRAKQVKQRLDELKSAVNLQDIFLLPKAIYINLLIHLTDVLL